MTYTLLAGTTTGRIDTDFGSFEIRDGRIEVDDIEDARRLVDAHSVEFLDEPSDDDPDERDADERDADEEQADDADADADADGDSDAGDGDNGDGDSDADVDLEALSYGDLQELAKAHEIPANQSTEDLIAALRDAGVGADA